MQRHGKQLIYAPSDLGNFVACEHLTQLDLRAVLGQGTRPYFSNAYVDLIARKGEEHERNFLEALRADGNGVTEVGLGCNRDFSAAAQATAEAMRAGSKYIYQAVFLTGDWHGIADFLERIDRPSGLGAWSYQVLDTKLARHPRPEHALQLCFYSHAVEQIQKLEPESAYVVLGTRERFLVRLANVSAYFRRLQRRFAEAVSARSETAPYPCEHCQVCSFSSMCQERWKREDHLVRVAGIRRDHVNRLLAAGITTFTALAEAPSEMRVAKISAATFEALHNQAALQFQSQRESKIVYCELPVESGRGFQALPRLSSGDVILDLEGHPFCEPARGLTFLFGVLTHDGGCPEYQPFWAHDRIGERRAFENFIDFVYTRLAKHPDLHIYHFGAYEGSAIKKLMGEYATRESEVDTFLRRKIFVNLYSIFRQALRAGVPSYSLKALEPLFEFKRTATVRSGMDAVVEYEYWRESQDQKSLDQIAAYNEEDCRATLELLEWLHKLRPAELPWPELPQPREVSDEAAEALNARHRLREELVKGAEPGNYRWLVGELLEYHRREARPGWWWYFERCGMTPEELLEDAESIGCLEPEENAIAIPRKKSLIHTLKFPPQDHKMAPGSAHDPGTSKSAGEILEIDDTTGTLKLLRGPKLSGTALPKALIPEGPYRDSDQRMALFRLAESIYKEEGRYPALEAVLKREPPRIQGFPTGARIHTIDLEQMKSYALELDSSYLFIQGPPGAGKTWAGARLIVHLIEKGKRIGVAAQSHKAIHNLLSEIDKFARETGLHFRGLKKSSADNPESGYESEFIKSEPQFNCIVEAGNRVQLLAGTAWLFSRLELDRSLDYLMIDEAGQVSLADALAIGTSARNVIFLGDPLQLSQVSQGIHPQGTGASVLQHLLGDAPTIPEDRGIFLERSYRMHPDVCSFISEIVYAGRLYSHESAARRTTSSGTGIRFVPVEHDGNRTASDEEVIAVAKLIAELRQGTFADSDGTIRSLREDDFMVVAPYNAQVRRLRAGLPAGVRVGTVDKFQGQQAPIVFFSMATSSGEDVPRNLEFLFSRNRLNVAISRAQCLAYLVCSSRLLDARCNSIEQMELVNALCRLAEYAERKVI